MHLYSEFRGNTFMFKNPVTSTRELERHCKLYNCTKVKYFFFFFSKRPCRHLLTQLYFCSADADTMLVTLVTLFIYFFYHPCTFLSQGWDWSSRSSLFVFVVMFEYYLISGFNIAGFATFVYLCSVKSNSHSCLIYQIYSKSSFK